MVRRQHCRVVHRATRSRCESRDDAVFPAVPTLCRAIVAGHMEEIYSDSMDNANEGCGVSFASECRQSREAERRCERLV